MTENLAMELSSVEATLLTQLKVQLRTSRRCVVLTGAGVSTESGIPDYRDASGAWKRTPPMTFQEFAASHAARQRYWARALIGWRQFSSVMPNRAHHALAQLEQAGIVSTLITQNVDGLHQRAGSHRVIDLHGRIDLVECLQCKATSSRADMQRKLSAHNPDWLGLHAEMAPDGDALLEHVDFARFQLPHCEQCAGVLKPAVVFYGESVPGHRVSAAYEAVRRADFMLVAGSSLMVMSGLRFVREAHELGIPVAAINLGRTRADELMTCRIAASCGAVLQHLVTDAGQPLQSELPASIATQPPAAAPGHHN